MLLGACWVNEPKESLQWTALHQWQSRRQICLHQPGRWAWSFSENSTWKKKCEAPSHFMSDKSHSKCDCMYEHRGMFKKLKPQPVQTWRSSVPSQRRPLRAGHSAMAMLVAFTPWKLAKAACSAFTLWKPVEKPLSTCYWHKVLERGVWALSPEALLKETLTPTPRNAWMQIHFIAHGRNFSSSYPGVCGSFPRTSSFLEDSEVWASGDCTGAMLHPYHWGAVLWQPKRPYHPEGLQWSSQPLLQACSSSAPGTLPWGCRRKGEEEDSNLSVLKLNELDFKNGNDDNNHTMHSHLSQVHYCDPPVSSCEKWGGY